MEDFNKPTETAEESEAGATVETEAASVPDVEAPIKMPKEPKKVKLSSVIAVSLVVCYLPGMTVLLLVGMGYVRIGSDKKSGGFDDQRFEEIYQLLKNHYVGELDEETMMLNALAVYTASTGDPYTQYLPKVTADGYIDGNY